MRIKLVGGISSSYSLHNPSLLWTIPAFKTPLQKKSPVAHRFSSAYSALHFGTNAGDRPT